MGYSTYYNLHVPEENKVLIQVLRNENPEAEDAFDENGRAEDCVKWYNHRTDMCNFSKNHPEVLFELDGEGEEGEDLWKEYYKEGKYQEARGKVTYDDFDETKLKNF